MLKLTVGVLAFVLASSASAGGWRSLRVDGSSEEAFNQSVVAFRDKLPFVRKEVFERSLQDIWVEGTKAAQAAGRDYTINDYLRDLDGLKYKEVVELTDPSGDTAARYFDQVYASHFGPASTPVGAAAMPRGGWEPGNRPREAGQSRTVSSSPNIGVNPWQR